MGDIGFKGVPDKAGVVEIGYRILPEYRNKDIATEAVKGLIEWAFQQAGVNSVVAECDATNSASIRVLEKSGMLRATPDKEMLKWYIDRKV